MPDYVWLDEFSHTRYFFDVISTHGQLKLADLVTAGLYYAMQMLNVDKTYFV